MFNTKRLKNKNLNKYLIFRHSFNKKKLTHICCFTLDEINKLIIINFTVFYLVIIKLNQHL